MKVYGSKGAATEKLNQLSTAIYEVGMEMFGGKTGGERKVMENVDVKGKKTGGKSRRDGKMEELRKEKNDKLWKNAVAEENEGTV